MRLLIFELSFKIFLTCQLRRLPFNNLTGFFVFNPIFMKEVRLIRFS